MMSKLTLTNSIAMAAIIVLIWAPIQYNKFTTKFAIKFSETFEKDFDKGLKKAFLYGWLTGANQMRDFGGCYVPEDTLMIMLQKDTSDFSYSIETVNNGN